jgi:hypothetical protein
MAEEETMAEVEAEAEDKEAAEELEEEEMKIVIIMGLERVMKLRGEA